MPSDIPNCGWCQLFGEIEHHPEGDWTMADIETGFDMTRIHNIIEGQTEMEQTNIAIANNPMPVQQLPVLSDKEKQAVLLGSNGQYISRAALATLRTPDETGTWKPIPHALLVDILFDELDRRDLHVEHQAYSVSHDGNKLFATFDLYRDDNDEFASSLGLRTSNDKSMSIQIAVGKKVFVCDNMCFSGDIIALRRKHTNGLKLEQEISRGLDRYQATQRDLDARIIKLKQKIMWQRDAEHMIYTAFEKEILPVRLFHPVIQSYRQVITHNNVSAWQLHNCFTVQAHKLPPARKFKATTAIGQLFKL